MKSKKTHRKLKTMFLSFPEMAVRKTYYNAYFCKVEQKKAVGNWKCLFMAHVHDK